MDLKRDGLDILILNVLGNNVCNSLIWLNICLLIAIDASDDLEPLKV